MCPTSSRSDWMIQMWPRLIVEDCCKRLCRMGPIESVATLGIKLIHECDQHINVVTVCLSHPNRIVHAGGITEWRLSGAV